MADVAVPYYSDAIGAHYGTTTPPSILIDQGAICNLKTTTLHVNHTTVGGGIRITNGAPVDQRQCTTTLFDASTHEIASSVFDDAVRDRQGATLN
jgi:hypothetical protein